MLSGEQSMQTGATMQPLEKGKHLQGKVSPAGHLDG